MIEGMAQQEGSRKRPFGVYVIVALQFLSAILLALGLVLLPRPRAQRMS